MDNKSLVPQNKVTELVPVATIPLPRILEELKLHGCPSNIIDKLYEWMIDKAFDRGKLERWIKQEGIPTEDE